jgi:hypothetical protein
MNHNINAISTIIDGLIGLNLNNNSANNYRDLYDINDMSMVERPTALMDVASIDIYADTDIRNPFVINTFRFKFTDLFMDELFRFSKVHQYDDRHAFKDAWTAWTDEHAAIVQTEVDRLTHNGYTGNIIEKMFKSARYYFRNKTVNAGPAAPRKQYIRTNKDIIDCIDTHIKNHLLTHSLKPQDGFIDFCETHPEAFAAAAKTLATNDLNATEIHNKIKKTYKNRYSKIVVVAKA